MRAILLALALLFPIHASANDKLKHFAASAVIAGATYYVTGDKRVALHLAGLLDQVEALMADPQTDTLARLAWTDAQEFRRTSPTLLAMATALNLTDAQLDQLVVTAAGIEA